MSLFQLLAGKKNCPPTTPMSPTTFMSWVSYCWFYTLLWVYGLHCTTVVGTKPQFFSQKTTPNSHQHVESNKPLSQDNIVSSRVHMTTNLWKSKHGCWCNIYFMADCVQLLAARKDVRQSTPLELMVPLHVLHLGDGDSTVTSTSASSMAPSSPPKWPRDYGPGKMLSFCFAAGMLGG